VVIDCELFARVSSIFSYLSGAPVRVGFHPTPRKACTAAPTSIARSCTILPAHRAPVPGAGGRARIRHLSALQGRAAGRFVEMPMLDIGPGERGEMAEAAGRDFPAIRGKKLVLVYPSGGILPIRAGRSNITAPLRALLGEGVAIGIIACNPTVPARKRSRTTAEPFAST